MRFVILFLLYYTKSSCRLIAAAGGGELEFGQKHHPTEAPPDFIRRWWRAAFAQALRQISPDQIFRWISNSGHHNLRDGHTFHRRSKCLVPILEATG